MAPPRFEIGCVELLVISLAAHRVLQVGAVHPDAVAIDVDLLLIHPKVEGSRVLGLQGRNSVLDELVLCRTASHRAIQLQRTGCAAGLTAMSCGSSGVVAPGVVHSRQGPAHDQRTNSWRAGCVETRTSGSEGGLKKRTIRKDGTALQSDPACHHDSATYWATGPYG